MRSSELHSTKIGTQEWTAKNLAVETFRNGDVIPFARRRAEWAVATRKRAPICADIDYDAKNRSALGRVYNLWAVNDPRGLAPEGWRISTAQDWDTLIAHVDSPSYRGAKRSADWVRAGMTQAGRVLKSARGWPKGWCVGTNDAKFGALPSGWCSPAGTFAGGATSSVLGVSDVEPDATACFWALGDDELGLWYELRATHDALLENRLAEPGFGAAVRCLRATRTPRERAPRGPRPRS